MRACSGSLCPWRTYAVSPNLLSLPGLSLHSLSCVRLLLSLFGLHASVWCIGTCRVRDLWGAARARSFSCVERVSVCTIYIIVIYILYIIILLCLCIMISSMSMI